MQFYAKFRNKKSFITAATCVSAFNCFLKFCRYVFSPFFSEVLLSHQENKSVQYIPP